MNSPDKSICLLIGKNDSTNSSSCRALSSEGVTSMLKQEVSEPETVGSHWSGQPGKDLFFNSWKLLF